MLGKILCHIITRGDEATVKYNKLVEMNHITSNLRYYIFIRGKYPTAHMGVFATAECDQ